LAQFALASRRTLYWELSKNTTLVLMKPQNQWLDLTMLQPREWDSLSRFKTQQLYW
jgi:hypothetical protein